MPYMRFAVLLLLVMVNAGISVRAETISQDDFLERLKQTHPLFIKERLAAQIGRQERASYLGDQDWFVQSSVFVSHEEPAIAIAGPEEADGLMFASGVRRLLWRTGGVLSASFSSGYANLELDPLLGVPDSYFEQRFDVAYSHPLLRNKHGVLDRLQYDLKQFDIDISEVIALENEEDFLIQAAARFLDWALLTEQRRIVTERLSLSEVQLSRTREKRNANLIDEVDVIRAEDAVRIARQNQLLVESQWLALQSELAVLAQDSSYYHAAPEYDLYQPKTFLSRDEAFAQLEAESRLLSSLTIRIEQLQVVRSGFAELRKADLSLVAQLGLEKADPGFGPSLAMNRPDARIGFQLAFPIGNRTAKAKIAQTDLQILQLEKQREELSLDLFSAVANVLTQAGQLETVLELNREQIESARRKTQEELRLYDLGRGELTFVIQSRDSEQAAQLTYAVNALNYQKLFLEYRALMDQLHR
jgi:outer membrane protein TolC